jgi:hypothetical protein
MAFGKNWEKKRREIFERFNRTIKLQQNHFEVEKIIVLSISQSEPFKFQQHRKLFSQISLTGFTKKKCLHFSNV